MDFILENLLEWIGYLASFIILISLVMRSIKRLRFINLFGSVLFTIYGYFIGSFPVMVMNAGIVVINIYYLRQMIKTEDYFKVIAVEKSDEYLKAFLAFYRKNIEKAMPFTEGDLLNSSYRFFILRNMVPAGLFIVNEYDKETLEITLDYATPAYQDFQTGAHVFKRTSEVFQAQGYKQFITFTQDESHMKYLNRMAFKPTTVHNRKAFIRTI